MSLAGKFLIKELQSIWLGGETVYAASAGTIANIKVLLRDSDSNILLASGTDIPASTIAGYAKGCIFILSDEVTGTTGLYENIGLSTSSQFSALGIVPGNVPAYVVKYAGEITWSGSGASLATTVTGVLASDIVIATIQSAPTEAAYLVSCAVTDDTITTTLSAANTSNDAVIAYSILRATT